MPSSPVGSATAVAPSHYASKDQIASPQPGQISSDRVAFDSAASPLVTEQGAFPPAKRFGIWIAVTSVCLVIAAFGAFVVLNSNRTSSKKTEVQSSEPATPKLPESAAQQAPAPPSTSEPMHPIEEPPPDQDTEPVTRKPHPSSPILVDQSVPRPLRPAEPPAPAQPPERPQPTSSGGAGTVAGSPQEPPILAPAPAPAPVPTRPGFEPSQLASGAAPSPRIRIPRTGYIVWQGIVDKNGVIEIDGNTCSPGTVNSGLPGVPVTIDLDTKNFGMVEYPSSSNGYRRMRIRSRNKVQSIIFKWQLAE